MQVKRMVEFLVVAKLLLKLMVKLTDLMRLKNYLMQLVLKLILMLP